MCRFLPSATVSGLRETAPTTSSTPSHGHTSTQTSVHTSPQLSRDTSTQTSGPTTLTSPQPNSDTSMQTSGLVTHPSSTQISGLATPTSSGPCTPSSTSPPHSDSHFLTPSYSPGNQGNTVVYVGTGGGVFVITILAITAACVAIVISCLKFRK
jgi:hypothetical protein